MDHHHPGELESLLPARRDAQRGQYHQHQNHQQERQGRYFPFALRSKVAIVGSALAVVALFSVLVSSLLPARPDHSPDATRRPQHHQPVGGGVSTSTTSLSRVNDCADSVRAEPATSFVKKGDFFPVSEGGRSGGSTGTGTSESRELPNVLFLLVDDVGMNDLGLLSTDISELTPYLDSLAGEGVSLTNYYTNHICTPARVS